MDILRLNRKRLSWNSLTLSYDGIPLGSGVLSIDYEQTRERKVVYGSRKSGKNVGTTSGKYTTTGSMKVIREVSEILKQYLTAKGLGSIGDASFTLILQAVEIPGAPLIVVLSDVEIKTIKFSSAEGVDELVDEYTFNEGFDVTENGMTLASRVREIG